MIKTKRSTIAITMGDPAGIGPEILVKSLLKPELSKLCNLIIIGDLKLLEKINKQLRADIHFKAVNSLRNVEGRIGIFEVIDLKNVDIEKLEIGKISEESGRASIEYIKRAVEYALKKEVEAIVTAPINKKAVSLAGGSHIGHTELIATLSGVKKPLTMFWVRGVRIFFLTRHLPLQDAIKAITKERIIEKTIQIEKELKYIGVREPQIAIAALNPHASNGGLIGKEEEREICPAIEELRKTGINAYGPIPADSVFHQAVEGRYDAVLSMFHDQGHIASKTLDFYGTVSVTLRLPFIRTSVDHGTAFDIAGKGIANSKSLEEAIKLAAKLIDASSLTSELS